MEELDDTRIRTSRGLPIHAFFLGVICLSTLIVQRQMQNHAQNKETQLGAEESLRTVKATRVEHSPKLEGTLDEPAWHMASPIIIRALLCSA